MEVLVQVDLVVTVKVLERNTVGFFQNAQRLIDSGAIGKVTHVQAEAYGPVVLKAAKPTWRGKAGGGGGCLYDYA
ncbi:MAG: gfo/Idh/MocA family oxidoreductase, partial [Cytophagaceae bacterium]